MQIPTIYIALLGLGTVGQGVYEVVEKLQKETFCHTIGANLHIKAVLVRNPEKYKGVLSDDILLTNDFNAILNDDSIQLIVEVMGGVQPAKDYIEQALQKGKHVVSANKDLIAIHGEQLSKMAEENGLDFQYEAAVMGAIPILRPLQECLIGNQIDEMVGIQNGTTNFILTKMTEFGWTFDKALEEATRLGYAEADPTADIEALDAGRKVAILARVAFHTPVVFDDVYTEGITQITPEDIIQAEELGCVIKLLGIARIDDGKVDVRVHPCLLNKQHPLASVNDSFNALFVHGNVVDEAMFYGRGAGKLPTASAVVGDICAIARNMLCHANGRVTSSVYNHLPIKDIKEVENRFYIRLKVCDATGVLAAIAQIFSEHNVSIAYVDQTSEKGTERAHLVLVTHLVQEGSFYAAIEEIRNLSSVNGIDNIIRVYGEL